MEFFHMHKPIVTLSFLMVLALPDAAAGDITPREAQGHIGETQTVCGKVVRTLVTSTAGDKSTLLYFDRVEPQPIFAAAIPDGDRLGNGTFPGSYMLKRVCVTGRIVVREDLPQIRVAAPYQIKVDSQVESESSTISKNCVPRSRCCKVCSKGKACGNSCISRSYTCRKGRGCSCNLSEICR